MPFSTKYRLIFSYLIDIATWVSCHGNAMVVPVWWNQWGFQQFSGAAMPVGFSHVFLWEAAVLLRGIIELLLGRIEAWFLPVMWVWAPLGVSQYSYSVASLQSRHGWERIAASEVTGSSFQGVSPHSLCKCILVLNAQNIITLIV